MLPSNAKVTDTKPNNISVTDQKPDNKMVLDIKPNNRLITDPTSIYTEYRTIFVGNPMGLLLTLTYPNTFTFTATRL